MRMPSRRLRPAVFALAGALAAWFAAHATAGPLEFVSPRDPIVAELRVLECYDLPSDSGRFRLPHFSTQPLQRVPALYER
jgi:hypothetical protein